ncbi:MAG: hypothetical protein NVS2B1_15510 [Bradyrhizobium sp.]
MLLTVAAGSLILAPARVQAQWWSRAPVDFEECADKAEKAATKEERKSQLTECNAKFAGRRKHGGGYTYFDFMQNRSFDIAGPNPTPEEQKKIDEQYTVYLDRERASHAAAAAAQRQLLQQASLRTEKVPTPVQAPNKRIAAASAVAPDVIRPRAKATDCRQDSFSCEWPRLSEGLNGLKKLFGPPPSKPKRRTASAS